METIREKYALRQKLSHRAINLVKKVFKRCYVNLLKAFFSRTARVDNHKIAVMTNTGMYNCNPKYLCLALKKINPELEITWLSRSEDKSEGYPSDNPATFLFTAKGIQAVYSSRVWLDNGIVFSQVFDKDDRHIHVQTMHGSLGIKRLDNAVNSRSRTWRGRRTIRREQKTDYILTNSAFEENVFRSVFWKDTPMLRLGHARTDILFSTDSGLIDGIRATLARDFGIPVHKRLALYAPTHRRGYDIKAQDINYDALAAALGRRFGGEWMVLIRLHGKTQDTWLNHVGGVIADVTDYPDIQELMLVSDVGITDYSSWIFDYVLTRRMGIIYATDIETYNNVTGFYYPLEETPFPICQNNDEVLAAVEGFEEAAYRERVEAFLQEKQCVDDGHSGERAAAWLNDLLAELPGDADEKGCRT